MRCCASIEEFGAATGAAYYRGSSFVRWRFERKVRGYWVWGRPTVDDARELVAVFDAEGRRGALGPHDSLADYSELQVVDPATFVVLLSHVRGQPEQTAPAREAVVRPADLPGAIIAGFFDVAARAARVFQTRGDALRWLGRAEVVPALDALRRASRRGAAPIVRRLHSLFAAHGERAPIGEAAALLKMSPRTLQHHLRAAGTHYRAERDRACLARAQEALASSDASVSHVAHDLGFDTLQRFSDWFRRLVGQPPSSWRLAQRHPAAPEP